MNFDRKPKRILAAAAVIFAALFVALNFSAYHQAYAMTHFVEHPKSFPRLEKMTVGQKLETIFYGVELGRPHSDFLPERLGPGARSLTIPVTNTVRLGAWYGAAGTNQPLVILFHGYGGQKTDCLEQAKVFQELGLAVLLVDFRGSGESTESYTSVGHDEAEDVAAAVRYAGASLPHSKLALYGISMGAAAELRAVHDCGAQPDAIIAEAVFDRMLTTVRHRFSLMGVPKFPGAELLVFWGGWQLGFNGFDNNPVAFAAAVRCPILFLHGGADPRALPAEARQVYEAVPGPKTFKEFPGIGHASIVLRYRQQWKDDVSQFLAGAGFSIR